jgi:protein-S-isoprenylcysteine O-methyltransferase Ste14
MKTREFFFRYRSYTPIPLILAALILAQTNWISFATGFIIACSGEMMRIWAIRYAGSATRTTGEVGADVLVINGPYGHVRNPLYLGNFLVSAGMFVMAWPWMPWFLFIFLLFFLIQYGSIISLEEEFLRNKFPDIFSTYTAAVPRFLPRLSSWGQGTRVPTTLKKALRTERNSLQSFFLICLLILLRWVYFS